jgi:hypothetical protein
VDELGLLSLLRILHFGRNRRVESCAGVRDTAAQRRCPSSLHWTSDLHHLTTTPIMTTTALQAPATRPRQLMGAESQTVDKVWGRVFTIMLAQEGGGWVRTFVVL